MKQFIVATAAFVNALGAHAIVACNHEHQSEKHVPGEDVAKTIRPFLEGPGFELCNDLPFANASEVLFYETPHYTFQIDRQEHTDSIENCRAAFQSILDECVIGEKVLGGDAYVNDIGYEIYHTDLRERDIVGGGELDGLMENLGSRSVDNGDDYDEDDDDDKDDDEVEDEENEEEDEEDEEEGDDEDEDGLERRELDKDHNVDLGMSDKEDLESRSLIARKGSRPLRTRPSRLRTRPSRLRTRPSRLRTRPSRLRTSPSRPKNKTSKEPKPTRCKKPNPGKGDRIQPRRLAGKTHGGKKQLAACQREDNLDCKKVLIKARAKNARENAKNKLLSRNVDAPLGLVDNLIHSLTKRGSKTGTACNEGKNTFNARSYPSDANARALANARVFGWEHPQQCQNMAWGHTASFRKVPAVLGGDYEVEHILEWQMVTKFFEWLDEDHFGGRAQFADPDPAQTAKIDFCTYWKKTWTPTFTIPVNGNRRLTAKKHLAWRYPGVDFRNEFVWLQADINAPAKQQMWTRKDTNQIYDLTDARRSINRNQNDAAVEAVRVKALLGALKYHKDPLVKQYFVAQVQRIRDALDEIDQTLPNHPPAAGHTAWQQQGLRNLWIKYMNEAFDTAKSRTDHTMNTMLKDLETKWIKRAQTPKNDNFKRTIRALRTEWRKEKRSGKGWMRPNW